MTVGADEGPVGSTGLWLRSLRLSPKQTQRLELWAERGRFPWKPALAPPPSSLWLAPPPHTCSLPLQPDRRRAAAPWKLLPVVTGVRGRHSDGSASSCVTHDDACCRVTVERSAITSCATFSTVFQLHCRLCVRIATQHNTCCRRCS